MMFFTGLINLHLWWYLIYSEMWKLLELPAFSSIRQPKSPGKRGHIVADTMLPMMFLGLRKLGNICCRHKMFLNKIRNIFCVPDTKFVSATNVARAGKRGNICVSNNVSSFALRPFRGMETESISEVLYFGNRRPFYHERLWRRSTNFGHGRYRYVCVESQQLAVEVRSS